MNRARRPVRSLMEDATSPRRSCPRSTKLERAMATILRTETFQERAPRPARRLRRTSDADHPRDAPRPRDRVRKRREDRVARPEARGSLPHRRAQGSTTRSDRCLLAEGDGQAADHRRDRRGTARRRRRRPAAALLGLPCEVYQGALDVERQAPNVARMKLLGARVIPVEEELTHAQGRDERGPPRLGDERRDDLLLGVGSCGRTAPLLRRSSPDLQRVIGDEAKAQCEATSNTPDAIVACVGGRLERDRDLPRVPRRSEGRALRRRGRRARARLGTARRDAESRAVSASSTERARTSFCDEHGLILEAHSVSAGLDYPGVGPEHSHLRDQKRALYLTATDDEALRGGRAASRGPKAS